MAELIFTTSAFRPMGRPVPGVPMLLDGSMVLVEPTSDSLALIGEALRMLRPLWRPGLRYFKAGVVLNDLVPEQVQPWTLFATRDPARSAKVVAALDTVNARYV